MWVVRVFMTIDVSLYDVEQYQLKWLRVLDYVDYLMDYYFNNNMLDHDE